MKLAAAILKYFPFGGLQRDLMRTAAEAHGRGHEVTIYTTSWEGEKPDWLTVRILNPFALNVLYVSSYSKSGSYTYVPSGSSISTHP